MARQRTHMRASGSVGGITYKKTKHGATMQEQVTAIDKNRILTDPKFKRTRENGAEFGRAGRSGRLIREAFSDVLSVAKDANLTPRMLKLMHSIVKSDATNDRGLRNVTDGNLSLLEGFDFNAGQSMRKAVTASYTPTINRATGVVTIAFDSFIPQQKLLAAPAATHFKLHAAATAINFNTESFVTIVDDTTDQPLDNVANAPLTLTLNLPLNSTDPILIVLGILYGQEVNSKVYPLGSNAYNALAVIAVSQL